MSLPVGVLMRFMPKPFDNDEDEDNSDGASSGGTGSSLLPREGLQGANAAGEINESGTYEAFPTAAAALSSSAGNFKHVMSSEQRMKKVGACAHKCEQSKCGARRTQTCFTYVPCTISSCYLK